MIVDMVTVTSICRSVVSGVGLSTSGLWVKRSLELIVCWLCTQTCCSGFLYPVVDLLFYISILDSVMTYQILPILTPLATRFAISLHSACFSPRNQPLASAQMIAFYSHFTASANNAVARHTQPTTYFIGGCSLLAVRCKVCSRSADVRRRA